MKKHILFILSAALSISAFSQDNKRTLIPCATYDAMEEGFKANPNLKLKYDLIRQQMEAEFQHSLTANKSSLRTMGTQSVIPVVFHIMGPLAVTDQVFINLISYINNDYGKTAPDVGSISPTFAPLYIDSDIRFALAKKDPTGNCTNGIIRHNAESSNWSQANPQYNYSGTGTGRWPTSQYLNVYIVDCIATNTSTCPVTSGSYVGGYTYLPGSTPFTGNGNKGDAIVIVKSELAQNDQTKSRTLSHEMGHWLNLSHTFGSTNNPGVTCGDDGITDTPDTKGFFSTCPASVGGNTCHASNNANVENIMDYSSCPKMFTQQQVAKMQATLASPIAGRSNLWSASNQAATGLSAGYTCAPVSEFTSNKITVCANNPVTYSDMSQVGTSGSLSWSFEGGTPATSTATAPVVNYSTPGTYSVILTATNGTGTNTKTKASYITVVQGAGGLAVPQTHNFETGGVGVSIINNNTGTVSWETNTQTGANGTPQSIFINNASQASSIGQVDIFETPFYYFSTTTNASLSYYYAYAKKSASQVDTFKVQYTYDCGGTWTNVLGIPTLNAMATNTGGTTATAYAPSSMQWKQTIIGNALLTNLNNKPSVKFRFYFKGGLAGGGSNNIFIDEINLSGTVGLSELENTLGLLIYPNPTNMSSTVDFNVYNNEKVKITVVDVVGRVMEESGIIATDGNKGNYVVNKNGLLAKGIYIINIDANNQRCSKKLVID